MGLEHRYADDGYLKPVNDEWQRSSRGNIHLAGDIGGLRGGEAAMISGRIAALSMLLQLGKLDEQQALRQRRHAWTRWRPSCASARA